MFVGNSMSQKFINELTEQMYGCRIDEFEEDKRSSSYKISFNITKSNDLFE
ncbi:9460_t:CDS:2, partial [Rhizophagus irregularis]